MLVPVSAIDGVCASLIG
jgi:hypothetical protein